MRWWLQSGGEASLVTKVVDVVNGTEPSRSLRDPPVITISKSAVAAVYKLTYMHVKPFGTTVHLFLNFSPFPHQNTLIRSACKDLFFTRFSLRMLLTNLRNTTWRRANANRTLVLTLLDTVKGNIFRGSYR